MVTVTVHLRDAKESRSRQQRTPKTSVTAWPKRIPSITESHQHSSRCHPCSRDSVRAVEPIRWCLQVILIKATSLCNSSHPVKQRLSVETCLLFLSIVLLSTRGEIKQLNISDSLVSLGLAKPANLYNKGSTIFLGFSGNFKPSWTKLFTSPAREGLGLLEQFVPLQLDGYGCPRAGTVRRRDLELLKQTSKAH